jgi:hypothetical protein
MCVSSLKTTVTLGMPLRDGWFSAQIGTYHLFMVDFVALNSLLRQFVSGCRLLVFSAKTAHLYCLRCVLYVCTRQTLRVEPGRLFHHRVLHCGTLAVVWDIEMLDLVRAAL